MSMMFATGASIVINNSGLPIAVLWSFLWVGVGMLAGWIAILRHKHVMEQAATERVNKQLVSKGSFEPGDDIQKMKEVQMGVIACERTLLQRMFSWKALHGCFMFLTWIQITGRIFASDQSGTFTCYTYPAFKPIDTNVHDGSAGRASGTVNFVTPDSPTYFNQPWAKIGGDENWAVLMFFGPMFGAWLVGAIYSVVAWYKDSRKRAAMPQTGETSLDRLRLVYRKGVLKWKERN